MRRRSESISKSWEFYETILPTLSVEAHEKKEDMGLLGALHPVLSAQHSLPLDPTL
jgi:hypothetical protein